MCDGPLLLDGKIDSVGFNDGRSQGSIEGLLDGIEGVDGYGEGIDS